ncbi:simple sugar transport system permease protein [Arthrobacter globiformis]|uniref:ABC transporter permease n=1 Tax=Arthrobacter globiformis TaxID=1665 RepID=UPI00278A09F7|nr:ABC transporter permease [Arthrobacter globiformis]MDQ1060466.1 simple sugar transport system permease protein [Arthrobacter globiformis]
MMLQTAPTGAPSVKILPPSFFERANKSTLLMAGVTLVLIVAFSIASPAFLSFVNVANMATQIAPVLIIGVAMTFVITGGQIDLSVGAIAAFVAATCAQLVQTGLNSAAVMVIGALMGLGWGLVNGLLSSYQKIPSFIVTLATLSMIRGLALLGTGGFSIPIPDYTIFRTVGNGEFLGITFMAWIAIVVFLIGLVMMHSMRFGQYTTGIGSSEESVRRAGVNTRAVKMWAMAFSGLAAGVAGVLIAARLGSGSANSATGLELTVIAAVVIGGTDLFGGRGTITGTLIGAILTGVIANGLTLVGMSPFLTPIITGLVLLIAIWINLRGKQLSDLVAKLLQK